MKAQHALERLVYLWQVGHTPGCLCHQCPKLRRSAKRLLFPCEQEPKRDCECACTKADPSPHDDSAE